MKRFIAGVISIVLCTTLLAGCGSSNSKNTSSSSASTDSKVLHTALVKSGENDTKVPFIWNNRGELYQVLAFRNLFKTDQTFTKVEPDLASGYKISQDGLTITLNLKSGLKWSDGQALTPADVKFSMQAVLQAASVNGIYVSAFSKIQGADDLKNKKTTELSGISIDGDKITIKLTEKVGNFMNVLTQFAILPEHCFKNTDLLQIQNDKYWQKPVVDGMYKFSKVAPGDYYELSINPDYEGTKPKIQKVIVNIVDSLVTAAQSGKADYLSSNSAGDIKEMNKLKNFKANPVNSLFYRYFIVNYKDANGNVNKKVADPRVREALLYAIDRKGLAEKLYPGLATVTNTGVPAGYPGHIDGESFAYNPKKAKELLKEANFDFSQTFKIGYYYADQSSIDFANAVAEELNAVGIKAEAYKFQGDPSTALYKVKDYDIALKGLSAFSVGEYYGEYSSSNQNYVNIFGKDSPFDSLYNQFVGESDPAQQKETLGKLQKLEQKELYKLPMFTMKNYVYINDKKVDTNGAKFANPWYAYDMNFQNWTLK